MTDESRYQKLEGIFKDPSFQTKDTQERYDHVIADMRKDPRFFFWFHQLAPYQFDALLKLIEPDLKDISRSSSLCLSMTLRYLCCNDDYSWKSFSLSESERDAIVGKVFKTITKTLTPIAFPRLSKERVVQSAFDFNELWNFPNCVGAISCRHLLCKPSVKGEAGHDIPFAAISDAYSRFIHPLMNVRFELGTLIGWQNFPVFQVMADMKAEHYPELKKDFPLVVVGSEEFPLTHNVMRPFDGPTTDVEERVFNYRLRRAKSAVETALGILFHRWRIFQWPIAGDKINSILQCACVLHNWLINQEIGLSPSERYYMPADLLHARDEHGYLVEWEWRI